MIAVRSLAANRFFKTTARGKGRRANWSGHRARGGEGGRGATVAQLVSSRKTARPRRRAGRDAIPVRIENGPSAPQGIWGSFHQQ